MDKHLLTNPQKRNQAQCTHRYVMKVKVACAEPNSARITPRSATRMDMLFTWRKLAGFAILTCTRAYRHGKCCF